MTTLRTVPFTIPEGVDEYVLFPGAWVEPDDSTDVWLASGIVHGIAIDSEALGDSGYEIFVNDYFDSATGQLIRGGSFGAAGCLAVTGAAALYDSPLGSGGFEVYAPAPPGVFTAANRRFAMHPNLANMQTYPVRAPCLYGMAVLFSGGAVTTVEHRCSIIYEAYTLGCKRKLLHDNYRSSSNSGALSFA